MQSRTQLIAIVAPALIMAGVAMAPQANAVTNCYAEASTDTGGYAHCDAGPGQFRVGLQCAMPIGNGPAGNAMGPWKSGGRVSEATVSGATCQRPFTGGIYKRNGRPVVWFETR